MAESSPSFATAVVAALLGGVVGGAAGFAAHAIFSEPVVVTPPPEQIQAELDPAALAALCEDQFADERTELKASQEKVKSLESQIAEKEAAIAEYKAQAEKDESKRADAVKRWRAMEQEVADLRVKLAAAESERDTLIVELKETIKELDTEIKARKKAEALAQHYKTESTENLWSAFGANAKVEVCDRGTKKRHENCHESVDAAMEPFKARFQTCVDTYQAVPVLKQREKKEDALPAFAEALPDDNKFTKKGWYIIFCDPTLPEAGEAAGLGAEPELGLDLDESVAPGEADGVAPMDDEGDAGAEGE